MTATERAARVRRNERLASVLAVIVVAIVIVAILGLALWLRAEAPCWLFSVAEAPVRCLPGAGR